MEFFSGNFEWSKDVFSIFHEVSNFLGKFSSHSVNIRCLDLNCAQSFFPVYVTFFLLFLSRKSLLKGKNYQSFSSSLHKSFSRTGKASKSCTVDLHIYNTPSYAIFEATLFQFLFKKPQVKFYSFSPNYATFYVLEEKIV